jgi:hypothetical protein
MKIHPRKLLIVVIIIKKLGWKAKKIASKRDYGAQKVENHCKDASTYFHFDHHGQLLFYYSVNFHKKKLFTSVHSIFTYPNSTKYQIKRQNKAKKREN